VDALWTFFRSDAFFARVTRLTVLIATVAAIDGILVRFRVDFISSYHLTVALFGSLLLNLYLLIELLVFPHRIIVPTPVPQTIHQPKAFVTALIDFVKALEEQGKISTVLDIRDSMSHLLHLLGEHEARYKLGEIALAAAVQAKDELGRAQILVDELGWAAFMLGKDTAAANIRRGVNIAESIPPSSPFVGQARLVAAKGYRHLAMVASDDASIVKNLEAARTTLKSLESVPTLEATVRREVMRDFAQIDHAEGTLIIRHLGFDKGAILRAADAEGTRKAQNALELLNRAATAFEAIGDYERLTKALLTKEHVLAGLGDETAALETKAQRDSVARLYSIRKQ
jgi:hypothetical protein